MGSDPSDGGSALVGVSIVLSIVQIFFVVLRFVTRYMQRTRCGADDYVILIALVCTTLPLPELKRCADISVQAGSIAKAIVYIIRELYYTHAHLLTRQPSNTLTEVEVAGLGSHLDETTLPAQSIALIRKVHTPHRFPSPSILTKSRASSFSESSTSP